MRLLSPALPALGLLFATVVAAAPRIPTVVPPERARVGAEYETAIPALPRSVEEFELFLLPEDGSGRMIRVTPEHEGHAASLCWRMPRVNAARARLVLRAGGDFGETESAPSAFFAIEAQRAPERAEVLRGQGELAWHFGLDGAPGAAALLPPGATALGIGRVASLAAIAQDGLTAEPPSRPRRAAAALNASTGPDPSAPHRSRRPALVPLRN